MIDDKIAPIPPNAPIQPIRAGMTRVIVRLGQEHFRMDLPSDKIDECIEDFESASDTPFRNHRQTLVGDTAVSGIARQEAAAGYNVRVGQAALWLLLHGSDRVRLQEVRDDFWKIVTRDGGALVSATCSGYDQRWSFVVSPTSF